MDSDIDKYDEPEVIYKSPEPIKEDFEQKWQMNQITKQLKSMMEREFVGLRTSLSGEFDQRTAGVIRQIEGLIQITVQKRLETIKDALMQEIQYERSKVLC